MSSFNDYSETIEVNNEILTLHLKISIKSKEYYICENYRVFENIENTYKEVKDEKLLNKINSIITLNRK